MNQCPICKHELFSDDITRCPACGEQFVHDVDHGISDAGTVESFLSDEIPVRSENAADDDQTVAELESLSIEDDLKSEETFVEDELIDQLVEPIEPTIELTADDDLRVSEPAFDQTVSLDSESEDEIDVAARTTTEMPVASFSSDVTLSDDDDTDHFEFDESDSVAETLAEDDEPESQSNQNDHTVVLPDTPDRREDFSSPDNLATLSFDGHAEEPSAVDATVRLEDASSASDAELKTLNMNWSDLDDANPAQTIKSQTFEIEIDDESVADTITAVPERSLQSGRAASNRIDSPEFQLLKVLGQGGMGVVWSARQTSVDRDVAIKMIKEGLASKGDQKNKFLAEAIVTGDLDHPNIVPIYDVGRDKKGALFYAMKQVQGTPWLKVIRTNSLHDNLEILLRVADAIGFAHARGIVHRDLKPENIMLGEFGEVLVMDWGLAYPLSQFRNAERLRQFSSMGGTPAYMAPEMATGPLNRITIQSDIYLLGAILWEIVTGSPPHPGKQVRECLLAAMRNKIRPTDKSGELVDIARKAMETDANKRHVTVREFQDAIRSYLEHSESLVITEKARIDLQQAINSQEYQDFSKSVFGFEQAYDLWAGNSGAANGVDEAKLAYAQAASQKEDYDLALSLLSTNKDDHLALRSKVLAKQHERDGRVRRLRFAKKLITGMAAAFFVVVCSGLYLIDQKRQEALTQKGIAENQKEIAQQQTDIAEQANRDLKVALDEEQKAKALATKAKEEVESVNRRLATTNTELQDALDQLKKEKEIAVAATDAANQAREDEAYEGYIARIGLAAAKIDENSFDVAKSLLTECPEDLRNWEWGRLAHLCNQESDNFKIDAPVNSVAVSPDGHLLLSGSWDHKARLWDLKTNELLREFAHDGLYVHSGDWSSDQKIIATCGSDSSGRIRFWDVETGELISKFDGHNEDVVRVRFSPKNKWLLSCSYDKTARLWDVRNPRQPREVQVLDGHSWWVWDAAFSPNFDHESLNEQQRIVTVSQDGTAIVWSQSRESLPVERSTVSFVPNAQQFPGIEAEFRKESIFTSHSGPVYAVAFAPDGKEIASAGNDQRILLWNPDELTKLSLDQFLDQKREDVSFRELTGHTSAVQSVQYSEDGDLLVSGSRDNSVKVWSRQDGKAITTFRGHFSEVRSVSFANATRNVVSGAKDGFVKVWNIDEYEEIRVLNGRRLRGHEDAVLSARFSPNGKQILTSGRDRSAILWSTTTGVAEKTFTEGHDYLTTSGLMLEEGRVLATAAADGSVRLWDVETGTQILRISETGRGALLTASSDGRYLVTGSQESQASIDDRSQSDRLAEILIWNVPHLLEASDKGITADELRNFVQPIVHKLHHHRVTSAAFVPDTHELLTGDARGRAILYNVDEQQEVWSVRHQAGRISGIVWSPDGKRAYLASRDNTVSCIEYSTGEEMTELILKHSGSVNSVSISPDGMFLVTVNAMETDDVLNPGSQLNYWDLKLNQLVRSFDFEEFAVNSVAFAGHGDAIIAVCNDNVVRAVNLNSEASSTNVLLDFQELGGLVWSARYVDNAKMILTVGGSEASLWNAETLQETMTFSPHGAVAAADFSADGMKIVTGSWDNSAKVWDIQTGQAIVKLQDGHAGYINSVRFSPDGESVLTASDDGTAKLWSVESGKVVKSFNGHAGRVRQAIFSPDGMNVLTVSNDRTARLWNSESAKMIGTPMRGHDWAILCCAFSNDGRRILTGGEDNQVRLWNAETQTVIQVYEGHTAAVTGVCFSRDEKRIFTTSQDHTAKVWDATAGHEGMEILTLTEQQEALTSIDVSADGRQVITGSRDGTAVLWLTSDWSEAAMKLDKASSVE